MGFQTDTMALLRVGDAVRCVFLHEKKERLMLYV